MLVAMGAQAAGDGYRLRGDPQQYQLQARPAWKLPAPRTTNPSTDARPFAEAIARAAAQAGIETELLHALVKTESGYRAEARSVKGATGLAQLMPDTAHRYDRKALSDTDRNLVVGARYLRSLLDQFDNALPLALAAYNAGPGAVTRYQGIPPYPETRDYVARVLAEYEALRRARQTVPQPWQLGSNTDGAQLRPPPDDS
jgi:soluble lytic murein transglycosylase-like protein